jgi:hypothetical protein
MEKVFKEFLKENNIDDFFDRTPSNKVIFKKDSPWLWINGRFLWSKQPEGHSFWSLLDAKWLVLLNEKGVLKSEE